MNILGRKNEPAGVAPFVNVPSVLRDEFDVDLDEVRAIAEQEGKIVTCCFYFDKHTTPGLIQAAEARGFKMILTSGDVGVNYLSMPPHSPLRVAQRQLLCLPYTGFKPVVETTNKSRLRAAAITPGEFGQPDALRNAASDGVILDDNA